MITTDLHDNQELKERFERYFKLVNLSKEGLLIHKQGVCVEVNLALEQLFGYDRSDLIGKEVLFLVAPEHRKIVVDNIMNQDPRPYEVLGVRKDGARIPVMIEGYDTIWQGEEIRVATMRDISKRKRDEDAAIQRLINDPYLVNSEHVPAGNPQDHTNLFRMLTVRYMAEKRNAQAMVLQEKEMNTRILNGFPGLFFIYAMGNQFPTLIKWNKNFESVTGFDPPELEGKNVLDFFGETEHAKIVQAIGELTEHGDSVVEANVIAKSGKNTPYLFTAKKFSEKDKDYFFGFGTDISKRKRAEEELERYNQKLEFMVHERTQALIGTNEQLANTNSELLSEREKLQSILRELRNTQKVLVQTEKMASIGTLTAGVAHEINNPLNFIQAGIYSLRSMLEDDTLAACMEDVEKVIGHMELGVSRVSSIVTSLNHFSRKREGKRENCDINAIIENCLLILRHESKSKCEVVTDLDRTLPKVMGNESNLHQVFTNLLANGIQAIVDWGLLRVETKRLVGKKSIQIIITDDGRGIAPEDLSRIFDPFFTTKDPGEGTGLGLSIVYQIIQDHRGSINYHSDIGKGTRVVIVLPIH